MLQYEADELLVDVIDEILVFEILLLNDDEVEQATFDATDEADDEALLIRLDETLLQHNELVDEDDVVYLLVMYLDDDEVVAYEAEIMVQIDIDEIDEYDLYQI